MSEKQLGDLRNIYCEMKEDEIIEELLHEMCFYISSSLLSEGKSADEVIAYFEETDLNDIIDRYETLTISEEVEIGNLEEGLGAIFKGLGFAGRFFGRKSAQQGIRTALQATSRRGAAPVAKSFASKAKTIRAKQAARQAAVNKKLGKTPTTPPSGPSGAATVATTAAQATAPKWLDKAKRALGGAVGAVLPGAIGFGAGYLTRSAQQAASDAAEKEKDEKKTEPAKVDIDYNKIFKKDPQEVTRADREPPEEKKVEAPSKEDQKKAKEEQLPDRAPSQLGDKTPYSKAATKKMSLRTRRILSGQSVYNRDPRARAGRDPRFEAYDVVLDYLISEGHAETVEEAHYVMMQMDAEHIQSIVEAGEGRVNLTYPAGHPKYGQPMKVDGKPMSVSKRTADWNSKMNRYKEQNPEGYKKAKGMMGPYGWSEPPKGYNPPNWM